MTSNPSNPSPRINRKASELDFQIVKASEKGRIAEIQELLAQGADPNAWIFFGLTAAMICAGSGYADCLAAMSSKVDLSVFDDKGDNALHKAASRGHLECVEILGKLAHADLLDASGRSACEIAEHRRRAAAPKN